MIECVTKRIKDLEKYADKANAVLKEKIKDEVVKFKDMKNSLTISNTGRMDLYNEFVWKYNLHKMLYEKVLDDQRVHSQINHFDEPGSKM